MLSVSGAETEAVVTSRPLIVVVLLWSATCPAQTTLSRGLRRRRPRLPSTSPSISGPRPNSGPNGADRRKNQPRLVVLLNHPPVSHPR
eukprot:33424-Prorocentrum_minimum.AAC.2